MAPLAQPFPDKSETYLVNIRQRNSKATFNVWYAGVIVEAKITKIPKSAFMSYQSDVPRFHMLLGAVPSDSL